jgi:hypothetical protein
MSKHLNWTWTFTQTFISLAMDAGVWTGDGLRACYLKTFKDWGGLRTSLMVRAGPEIGQGPPGVLFRTSTEPALSELDSTKCPFYHPPCARFTAMALTLWQISPLFRDTSESIKSLKMANSTKQGPLFISIPNNQYPEPTMEGALLYRWRSVLLTAERTAGNCRKAWSENWDQAVLCLIACLFSLCGRTMLPLLPHILSEEVTGQWRNEHLTLDSKVRTLSSVIASVCWTLPTGKFG